PPGIDDDDFDPKGDILLLKKLLNDYPSSHLPPKELNFEELKMIKSLIDDFPPLNILGGNFVTFFNPLFDANDYFTFSDDESLPEEDIQEENFIIYSNPLGYHDSEGDKIFLEYLLKKIDSMDSYLLFSSGSEDIIFDPGIPVFSFYSIEPVVSHRSGTSCASMFI
ncbi:hypothetical protein Tco_0036179, partial [Tanacetum coccineum]